MRIGKFGVQNQSELWVVLHLVVTKSHGPTFLGGVSADDWVQDWIDRLVNVLNEHRVASYDRLLDHIQVVLLTESHHKQLRIASRTTAFRQRRITRLDI